MTNSDKVLNELVKLENSNPRNENAIYQTKCDFLEAMYQEGCEANLCGESSEIDALVNRQKFLGCDND